MQICKMLNIRKVICLYIIQTYSLGQFFVFLKAMIVTFIKVCGIIHAYTAEI